MSIRPCVLTHASSSAHCAALRSLTSNRPSVTIRSRVRSAKSDDNASDDHRSYCERSAPVRFGRESNRTATRSSLRRDRRHSRLFAASPVLPVTCVH